jgi:hypothetical protein
MAKYRGKRARLLGGAGVVSLIRGETPIEKNRLVARDEDRRALGRVAGSCADEYGVLVTSEAIRSGLPYHQIRRLVDEGLLVREFRGVYRWAAAPATDLQRVKLAVCATRGVASHQSAARIWDWERWDSSCVHVTVSRGRRAPQSPWLFTHESERTLRGRTLMRHGIPVTKPLPTLLGIAAGTACDEDLGDLFAHLVSRRLVSVAQAVRFVEREGAGVAGVARLRSLLADVNGGAAESVAERQLLQVLADAGIERPKTQFAIYRRRTLCCTGGCCLAEFSGGA